MVKEKQWTVVGKPQSTNKLNGAGTAAYKQVFAEGKNISGPNKFDALKSRPKNPVKPDLVKSESKIPRPKKETEKADVETKKPVKKTVDTEMAGFDLQTVARKAAKDFRGKPELVLNFVGSWLNNQLIEYPMYSPVHPKKPTDYPFRMLSEASQQTFLDTVQKCDEADAQKLLADVFNAILTDVRDGKSVWGYQVVAQALAFRHPKVFLINLDKYQSHILKYKSHATAAQAGLWCLAQAGNHDFSIGFKVWLKLMLPLLGVKNLGQYAVNCLVTLLKAGSERSELSSVSGLIDIKQYFLILDGVYSNSTFPGDVQQKLKDCYSMISEIALSFGPKRAPSDFFPSFLTRLSPDSSEELREELISKLTICLQDKASLKAWSKIYENHLVHSRVLLYHMTANWPKLRTTVNQKALSDFLKTCLLKHESLKTNNAQLAHSACQSLVEMIVQHQPLSLSGSSSRCCGLVFKLFFMILLLGGGLLAADVYTHSGYADSVTARTLEAVGADVYVDTAAHLAQSYFKQASSYLAKNVPMWLEYIWTVSEPTLTMLYGYAIEGIKYIVVVTDPARQWIATNVPIYIDWVIMHPWWGHMYDYLSQAIEFIRPYAAVLLKTISTYMNQAYDFVEKTLV